MTHPPRKPRRPAVEREQPEPTAGEEAGLDAESPLAADEEDGDSHDHSAAEEDIQSGQPRTRDAILDEGG